MMNYKVQVGYKKGVPPPTFAGYKNDLYGNPLYDDTLAVSVYIADALVSTAEVIKIPLRILENNLSVAQRDGVNGHSSQWVLLHPTPGTNIQQHEYIGWVLSMCMEKQLMSQGMCWIIA